MTTPALLPVNVDYTTKDFDSIRARLFQLIRSVFPAWTDESVANFGNILVELFAFVGDVLTFYMDNHGRESRITTARLRRSLLALCKLTGYQPAGATAATVDVVLTFTPPPAGTLTIPIGDTAKTAEITAPILYQFTEPLVVAPGSATANATLENSTTPPSASFGSTGLADQVVTLPEGPYLDGSARVSDAGAGPAEEEDGGWARVDNFFASTAEDRHYVLTVDQADRASIKFGSGANGRVPSGTIVVTYKVGGGDGGRVEAGALSEMSRRTYLDSLGNQVQVSVTNPAASSGGTPRETNAQIKQNAPEAVRVLRRAVAREDYEIVAQQVPGVARALMVTSNEYAVPENEGLLMVATDDGGAPSAGLLAEVAGHFEAGGSHPKPVTFRLTTQGAAYATMDVTATIYLSPGAVPAIVKAAVQADLAAFFAPRLADGSANPTVNFGYYYQGQDGSPTGKLAWSKVFNVVNDAAGVERVDPGPTGFLINGLRADPPLSAIQFPRLGAVTLIDGATSLPL